MPDPRVAHCVFCDDIRQELGNKLSLMGVYSGELLIFQKPPIILPKLGIVAWLISDADDKPTKMDLSILSPPDGQQLVKLENDLSDLVISNMEGARKVMQQIIFPITPFPILQEGMFEVYIETERERLRAGRLLVKVISSEDEQATH